MKSLLLISFCLAIIFGWIIPIITAVENYEDIDEDPVPPIKDDETEYDFYYRD